MGFKQDKKLFRQTGKNPNLDAALTLCVPRYAGEICFICKKILHYILMFLWFRYADSINKKISRVFGEFFSLQKIKYWCSKLTQKNLPPHGMQMDIFAFISGMKWIRVLVFFLDFSNEIVMLFSSKMLTYIFG